MRGTNSCYNIYPIYFIILFLGIVIIFLWTQLSHFKDLYIIRHYFFVVFTYLIYFIRFLVITHIHLIYFIRLFSILSIFFCKINFPSFKTSISSVPFSSTFFYLSDIFRRIPCHHSYPSDFFHRIISQYSIYFSANSIFAVSILLYLYSMFLLCFFQSDIFRRIPCHK